MAKKLWGGRFKKATDPLVEEFTRSIQYDYKLAQYDLLGSIAHVDILKRCGYLTAQEAARLDKGLNDIYTSIEKGMFKPDLTCEDIHTNIQNALGRLVGDLALKLHTARSRNDQVAFATKLYCKISLTEEQLNITNLNKAIFDLAVRNSHIIIPGFTHMQHAQPVLLRDYLWAYIEMLVRDQQRLAHISKTLHITLGAGALAGTPIDAAQYHIKVSEFIKEKQVGEAFEIRANKNSIDAVSDRDFVIEIISALSLCAMHLSRLSEDLIIWSTKEFDFIELDDAYCTGSSLMPQKKNADCLELIRGNTGRLYGNLIAVLTMMKGLPLSYNRDMQLDKEPLFNSFEIMTMELVLLQGIISTLAFKEEKINAHLKDESLYATDLVYYLVDKGVAFKKAHDIVGNLIRHSLEEKIQIKNMSEHSLKGFSDKFRKADVVKLFNPVVSVKSRKSVKR